MDIFNINCTEIVDNNNNKDWVMREFAKRLNVTPMQILEPDKSSHISDIRYLYCKLRRDKHGITYSAAAREIGRSPATVSYGVNRINGLLCTNDKKLVAMWNRVKDISDLHRAETTY